LWTFDDGRRRSRVPFSVATTLTFDRPDEHGYGAGCVGKIADDTVTGTINTIDPEAGMANNTACSISGMPA
jgi:hypothetical protein